MSAVRRALVQPGMSWLRALPRLLASPRRSSLVTPSGYQCVLRQVTAFSRRSFAANSEASKAGLIQYRMHYPDGQAPPATDRDVVRSKWHSDAMDLIEQVPPLVVESEVIACNGGPNAAMGHPIEYIRVDAGDPAPSVCKYCGLRYIHRSVAATEGRTDE
ncbi:NADH dehydrogenase Fe-S protein subunit 6 ndufs6 [Cyanidiococcus yangmingshanensis]|uniref:NADH dehydrogenase Fe-S protein subunit 6 ndufs6 n=1 Tax=Cyanidiococcus yangmingshanensis TaxID=2690220 RepID=A0A7J7IHL8_9RHOD|nr:NADH dehydrogenase Fe-S protein subunit 6 ndufs6 [Cyanidiococcus yangmingshanensis]